MDKQLATEQAQKLTEELKPLWQLIQFSVGQNQALQVALGSALRNLPADSPLRAIVLQDLESYGRLMQLDPKALGRLDGFADVLQSLSKSLGEDPIAGSPNSQARGH